MMMRRGRRGMRALQDEWPALPHALPLSSSQKLYQMYCKCATNILQMCSKYIVNLSNIIASSDECSVVEGSCTLHSQCWFTSVFEWSNFNTSVWLRMTLLIVVQCTCTSTNLSFAWDSHRPLFLLTQHIVECTLCPFSLCVVCTGILG